MTNPDELERLARAAYHDYALADIAVGGGMKATVSVPAFIAAANPATILALLSANREMREALRPLAPADDETAAYFEGMNADETVTITIPVRCIWRAQSALTAQTGGGE